MIALLPLSGFIWFLHLSRIQGAGPFVTPAFDWVPALGISLRLQLDGLSLLFALLISGIGFLVVGYTGSYLRPEDDHARFHALMLLFFLAMIGIVTADNLLVLYVFWELTTIASFLLIGFDHRVVEARTSAHQALVVTASGGLSMLGGFVLLGIAGGSFVVSELVSSRSVLLESPLFSPALILILIGAFTKSAQFPFHFWLPNAMIAPTPVSAYLHSAAMVKAGIYLLFRLQSIIGGTALWYVALVSTGVVTMLLGAIMAFLSSDLKRVLAYSTISALGMIVLFIGSGSERGLTGAFVFTIAHALYKCALFLVVGTIDHAAGSRRVEELRGLARAMPATATAAVLAALSLAGLGPVLSFLGKEKLLASAFELPLGDGLVTIALVFTSTLFTAVALLVAHRPFHGRRPSAPESPHEGPPGLWAPPLLLGATGIVLSLFPGILEPLVTSSLGAIGIRHEVDLALWHGLTPELAWSLTAVALGIIVYAGWRVARRAREWLAASTNWTMENAYELTLDTIRKSADLQRMLIERGPPRIYLGVMLVTLFGGSGYLLIRRTGIQLPWGTPPLLIEWALMAMMASGAIAAIFIRNRIGAIISLSTVGYGVALLFVGFSAPDLAMTQILFETFLIILLVPLLGALPHAETHEKRSSRLVSAIVAIGSGVMVTLLVLASAGYRADPVLSRFYVEMAETQARGRNIVNVILVDFRTLDTIGEVTVFTIAALGVYSLMRVRPRRESS